MYNVFTMQSYLDDFIRKRCHHVSESKPKFKYRFKDEFYDKLAIATLGESLYEQMKNGKLQWGKLEDEQFIMAEFLQEYLEKYKYKEKDLEEIKETLDSEKQQKKK